MQFYLHLNCFLKKGSQKRDFSGKEYMITIEKASVYNKGMTK